MKQKFAFPLLKHIFFRARTTLGLIGLSLILLSCSSVDLKVYKDQKPDFDFEQFFSGNLEAHGIFQDRSGVAIKQIHCQMSAQNMNGEIIIDEKFDYSDGTKDTRVWKIKKLSDGVYEGTAGDVIGVAKIETTGFVFHMSYRLALKVDGKTVEVNMDDWMYRVTNKLVINKTSMSKWGFHLGDVSLAIQKN